ncbi:MAG: hypothetical protein ACJAS1_000287 [Oleiphilaceae bacterium]|jgi:hypothetical protein
MINRSALLKDLQRELPKVEKDILEYSESKAELAEHLQEEYEKAQAAGRTAEHFVAWREAQITQAAVAWLLTCVFVRFLEDNNLLVEPMLSGPANSKVDGKEIKPLQHAKERMVAFFNEHPTLEEREYLLDLFSELERFPVIAELLDHRHNPLYQIPVSSDGAKALIDFFQKIDANSGEVMHDFTDADWDTRFLGDLYQDLSESVRKRYALLQTPEFVESFILDYTLEKAKDTFGLPGLRLIDPTCGSGHFLLSTFERMFDVWQKREPGTNTRELAQRALDVVHGVDINPYAIAICRFRLFVAAMKAAGSHKVKDAPDFNFNLACGDSLLHGKRFEWQGQGQQSDLIDEDPVKHVLEVEDKDKLLKILGQQYHAVVGNPPYITVSDKALNLAYRDRFITCHRKYSLGVPFTERLFDLSFAGNGNTSGGYIGVITTNSFMKREFGKKLIEEYLPRKDLTHLIDTSGAYIPGHGTPTVIMFARNRSPISADLRAVLGTRGEPGIPSDPSKGKVWTSILNKIDKPGSEDDFISVVDQPRDIYFKHPWTVTGGGAGELKSIIESDKKVLGEEIELIGFGAILGEDEAFSIPKEKVESSQLPSFRRPLVEGEFVRDWGVGYSTEVVFPYDKKDISLCVPEDVSKFLWGVRTPLWNRNTFAKETYKEAGRSYAEFHQIPIERNRTPLTITFAFVATHNHFAFDRGGKIFNRSAPMIKLPPDTHESRYVDLLGVLNSSIACFWMKQVFHNKGNGGIGGGIGDESWEPRYEFDGTKLKSFPMPSKIDRALSDLAVRLEGLSREIVVESPELALLNDGCEVVEKVCLSEEKEALLLGSMIGLQEEVDWSVYTHYDLGSRDLIYQGEVPEVRLGERAFEIYLARRIENEGLETAWFERHGSKPVTEIPGRWPEAYRTVVEKRIAAIGSDRWIKLIEQPEYKRRWNQKSWKVRLDEALKKEILRRVEKIVGSEAIYSCAQVADMTRSNSYLLQLVTLYTGSDTYDLQCVISDLITCDVVPQHSTSRLKPAAMKKFHAWQETWDKQRQEDVIDIEFGIDKPLSEDDAAKEEKVATYEVAKAKAAAKKAEVVGDIPVPPKYAAGDFRKPIYWKLRGKLDVPKERFFSLPSCEKDGDSTLVIGWAGMNHLQRATAIATWYLDRKETDGWEAEKLKPMLVALDELIPWLKQWHNEIDPEFGERMGDYYEGFLLEEMRMLDVTKDDLLAWEPPAAPKKKAAKKKTAAKKTKPKSESVEANDTDTSKEQG